MCGIAGYISLSGSPADARVIRSMTEAVAHRGPDGEGTYIDGPVAFGHRRLAILDLTPDGIQPMKSADGQLVLTFNGEIYNYIELREELRALGHSFRTATDSEVILAAYAQWGPSCVKRFNGMWGFAIHDVRANRVFCSRDRFGVKPFYFVREGSFIAFGSEIRQLLPLLPACRADRQVVIDFLLGGGCEPLERTFFEGIRKLPGGRSMTIDLATGAIDVERHYELRIDPSVGQLGPEEAAALYGARLEDATLLRLRADVRVGTCLSGGLDSSSVAALAAPAYEAARSEPFCAITAVSEQSSNDESGFAELVVKRLGLEWIRVRPDYSAFASTVRDVALTQEEPFDSPSVCMQYFVMRAAREADIPVLLDGQGGDETLLGYRNYFAALISSKLRSRGIASSVREYLRIRRLAAETGVSTARLLAEVALLESGALRRIRSRRRGWFLRGAPRLPEIQDRRAEATRELRQFQVLEVTEAILPTLLRYEDKNSMRHAIETRLPFLDYRSVETAISLAPESKIYRGWTKYPLRRAMDHRLPAAIAWRRTKLGFEAPADLWMRMHYGQMLAAVEDSRILGEVTEQRHRDRLFLGTTPSTRWRLFSIALWEQAFGVT